MKKWIRKGILIRNDSQRISVTVKHDAPLDTMLSDGHEKHFKAAEKVETILNSHDELLAACIEARNAFANETWHVGITKRLEAAIANATE